MPDQFPARARAAGVPLPLWPEGSVPGARGREDRDVPRLTAHFAPEAPPGSAAVVVCPGGGYAGLAAHEGAPVAHWLNALGIHAFVLQYRVAPYLHPCPLSDAQRAIRTLRHHASDWGLAAGHVGILGFSAGGHLASTAGTHFDAGQPAAADAIERQGCRPDALILCYAVITFGQYRHEGSMHNLLGRPAPEDLRTSLSNELQVTAQTPPTFLWHTADDAGVPVENSLLFALALRRAGVPFGLHVYERGAHGLGLAEHDRDVGSWTERCGTWLAGHGFGHGPR